MPQLIALARTDTDRVPPEIFLQAYRQGLFPMADNVHRPSLHWLAADPRTVLPLDRLHVPKSLRKTLRRGTFDVTVDTAFADVFDACAGLGVGHKRPGSWINAPIRTGFRELHALGHAHSVECWKDGRLAGGLYGLAIGGAFFGESMFAAEPDASKTALVHLVARLRAGGFRLLDSQILTDHMARFGATEIGLVEFNQRLVAALPLGAQWDPDPAAVAAQLAAIAGVTVGEPTEAA